MIPRGPARRPQLGFVYTAPYRIQGISIAGEETVIQIPELDVCFDIGRAPRAALVSKFVALSHGHMDHSAGLAYYFSQRHFQGMGVGTIVCHPRLEKPIHNIMRAWVDLEAQRTPYNIITLAHNQETEIKNNIYLRGFETRHGVPSLGFCILEFRKKLRSDLVGMPREQLVALKKKGEQITQTIEMPLVCYTGDTTWGDHFEREDVLQSPILITECTFLEDDHRDRAKAGKHLHLDNIIDLLEVSKAKHVILTHLSRRTHMSQARQQIFKAIPKRHHERIILLMDHNANRASYQQQLQACQDTDDTNESS